MSLQRIFNVARKLGTPVIMTDAEGREPLVVLSLDQFEAMAGVSADPIEEERAAMPEPVLAKQEVQKEKKVDNKAKNELPTVQMEEMTSISTENTEIPLEERFYLEPLEGEDGLGGQS